MKYIVDRIENDIAVLESFSDKKIINVPLENIKINISEGDVLIFDGKNYTLNIGEKEDRLKIIMEKMKRLKK